MLAAAPEADVLASAPEADVLAAAPEADALAAAPVASVLLASRMMNSQSFPPNGTTVKWPGWRFKKFFNDLGGRFAANKCFTLPGNFMGCQRVSLRSCNKLLNTSPSRTSCSCGCPGGTNLGNGRFGVPEADGAAAAPGAHGLVLAAAPEADVAATAPGAHGLVLAAAPEANALAAHWAFCCAVKPACNQGMPPETDGANASAAACALLPMSRMRAGSLNVDGCKRTKSGPAMMQKRNVCMQHSSSAFSAVSASTRTLQGLGGVALRKRFGNRNSHAAPPEADAVGMCVMNVSKVWTTPPLCSGLQVLDMWFANKRRQVGPAKWPPDTDACNSSCTAAVNSPHSVKPASCDNSGFDMLSELGNPRGRWVTNGGGNKRLQV